MELLIAGQTDNVVCIFFQWKKCGIVLPLHMASHLRNYRLVTCLNRNENVSFALYLKNLHLLLSKKQALNDIQVIRNCKHLMCICV